MRRRMCLILAVSMTLSSKLRGLLARLRASTVQQQLHLSHRYGTIEDRPSRCVAARGSALFDYPCKLARPTPFRYRARLRYCLGVHITPAMFTASKSICARIKTTLFDMASRSHFHRTSEVARKHYRYAGNMQYAEYIFQIRSQRSTQHG